MLLNYGAGEDSWESLGLQGDPISPFWRRSVLGVLSKDWCWSWNSSTLATWCKELTHWKRLWCWEGLGAGEGDDRGWDGWMVSLTRWTWVWVNSGSWWWTGKPGVLRFMGSDTTERLNWTEGDKSYNHLHRYRRGTWDNSLYILDCNRCYSKVPQTCGMDNRNIPFDRSGGCKVQDQGGFFCSFSPWVARGLLLAPSPGLSYVCTCS